VIQSSRLIAAEIRVVARYPATATRGLLSGVNVPYETLNNARALNFDGMTDLNGSHWATSDAAGQIGISVTSRPFSVTSYELSQQFGTNTQTSSGQFLIVAATGWPLSSASPYNFEVSVIGHYETNGGFDFPADDEDEVENNNLAASGISMDQAGQLALQTPPVKTSVSMMESLDAALTNIHRSGSRTGFAGRPSRGFMTQNETVSGGQHFPDSAPSDYFGPIPSVRSSLRPAVLPSSPGFVMVSEEAASKAGLCVRTTGLAPG